MSLPDKVTATVADDGPDGRVYRLADNRGYTKVHDTIRVSSATHATSISSGVTVYAIHIWRKEGWIALLTGYMPRGGGVPYDEAVQRAVAVLYGTEDHG